MTTYWPRRWGFSKFEAGVLNLEADIYNLEARLFNLMVNVWLLSCKFMVTF